jgi:tetratricopeptide (TPR) repeat protein
MMAINAILREFENGRAAWQWLVAERRFEQIVDQLLTPIFLWAFYRQSWEGVWSLLQSAVAIMPEEGVDQRRRLIFSIAYLNGLGEIFWWTWAREKAREIWEQIAGMKSAELIQLGIWYPFLVSHYGYSIETEGAIEALRAYIVEVRKTDDVWTLGWCLYVLGGLAFHVRRFDEAMAALTEAEALCVRHGQLTDLVSVLQEMAEIARTLGDYQGALSLLARAKSIVIESDNKVGVAVLAYTLAEVALQLGNIEEALVYYQEQHQLFMAVGNRARAYNALHWRCLLTYRYGSLDEAWRLRQEHLRLTREAGLDQEYAWGLWEAGELARVSGDAATALQYFQESHAVMQEARLDMGIGFYHRGLGDLALARGEFDEAAEHFETYLEKALAENRNWSVAYALVGLGKSATGRGDYELAGRYLAVSVARAQDEGTQDLITLGLAALAELYLQTGNLRRAVEIAAFVQNYRLTWGYVRDEAQAVLTQAEASLPAEAFVTAEWRARKLQMATLLAEVAATHQSSQSGNAS